MEKKLKWELSDRLVSYFASSVYGQKWDVIAVREALQNSVDAHSRTFRLNMIDNRNVIIENDGFPMSLETIEKQLFTLGESSKTNGKETGFFGVGECAIISPSETWEIQTGEYVIKDFVLRDKQPYFKGTKHTLKFREDIWKGRLREFLKCHNVKTKVIFQDNLGTETIKPLNLKRCRVFPIPNGVFTWKKSGEDYTVIRVNGVPQTRERRYDNYGLWVIDLNTSTILTVNREAIREDSTRKAIDIIAEQIRNISGHVSGDKTEDYVQIVAPFPYYRKVGVIDRHDPNSKPLMKMYKTLEVLDEYVKNLVTQKDKNQTFNHKVGLVNSGSTSYAMVHMNTILINVYVRNINPPTTYILKLIDDYTHELAHIIYSSNAHESGSGYLRNLIWEHSDIIEQLRKFLRYD